MKAGRRLDFGSGAADRTGVSCWRRLFSICFFRSEDCSYSKLDRTEAYSMHFTLFCLEREERQRSSDGVLALLRVDGTLGILHGEERLSGGYLCSLKLSR
jgi:hypothetical protein